MSGGSSNDTLFGGGGSDALRGNDGVDILFGGDGLDFIEGGAGSDTLVGGIGLDFLFGGTGSDVVSLLPNEGTDTIIGGEDVGDGDIDVLRSDGSEGLSVVFTAAEAGSATVTGTTATFSQIERVELTDFGDTVDGSASAEALSIEGLGGNDTITGGSDGDQLYGGDDDDALYGGPGDDTLYGGSDDDELFGGAGADTLYGDAGNDAITVDGSDSAFGGLNSDEFTVGATDGSPIFIDGDEDPDDSDIDTLDIRGLTAANGQPLRRSDITFVPGTGEEDGSFVLQDGTVVTFQNIEAIICFAAGTMIRTPEGERAVETLAEGDLVVTRDGTAKPIRWTGRRTVPAEGRLAPIAIAAGALGNAEALRVSPMHRMLLTDWRAEILFGSAEVLVAAKHLVNGDTIRQVPGGTVDYVHILFDRHEIVFANGALSESFHPGHVGLDALEDEAREELLTLFPELREDAAAYGPTALPSLKAYEARALIG